MHEGAFLWRPEILLMKSWGLAIIWGNHTRFIFYSFGLYYRHCSSKIIYNISIIIYFIMLKKLFNLRGPKAWLARGTLRILEPALRSGHVVQWSWFFHGPRPITDSVIGLLWCKLVFNFVSNGDMCMLSWFAKWATHCFGRSIVDKVASIFCTLFLLLGYNPHVFTFENVCN